MTPQPEIEKFFNEKYEEVKNLRLNIGHFHGGILFNVFGSYNKDLYNKLTELINFNDINHFLNIGKQLFSSKANQFSSLIDLIINSLSEEISFIDDNKDKYIELRPDMPKVAENYLNDYMSMLNKLKENFEEIKKLKELQ
jgi:hypothetical protein